MENSNIEMVKKLKELLDLGAITQEEFDIKKRELLGFDTISVDKEKEKSEYTPITNDVTRKKQQTEITTKKTVTENTDIDYSNTVSSNFSEHTGEKKDIKKVKPIYADGTMGSIAFLLSLVGFFVVTGLVGVVLGIAQIYRNGTKKGFKRALAAIIIGLFWVIVMLGLFSEDSDATDVNPANETTAINESFTDDPAAASAEDTNIIGADELDYTIFDDAAKEISDYSFIKAEDFKQYYANLKGQKLCFVATFDNTDHYSDNGYYQVHIGDDGYMFSNCYTDIDYSNYNSIISEDTLVLVIGTYSEFTSYGALLGTSHEFTDCKIVAYGSDVNQYLNQESDDALSDLFIINEEVVKAVGADDISKEDFINICQTYSYEDILRNPDSYEEKYCYIVGTIYQVVEGIFSDSIYVKDSSGNIWACRYSFSEGESRVLEGDYVTAYGILDGTGTTETILGKQVTMPYVNVKYWN